MDERVKMTAEIRETKEAELEDIESSIEGLKYLLKQKKVHRKSLRKELKYIIEDDGTLADIKKEIEEIKYLN